MTAEFSSLSGRQRANFAAAHMRFLVGKIFGRLVLVPTAAGILITEWAWIDWEFHTLVVLIDL